MILYMVPVLDRASRKQVEDQRHNIFVLIKLFDQHMQVMKEMKP